MSCDNIIEINGLDYLDVLEYAIKRYRNKELDSKCSLLEYYALTDLNPKEMANVACSYGRKSLGVGLRRFAVENNCLSDELHMEKELMNYSVNLMNNISFRYERYFC